MTARDHKRYEEDLGAYLLGALTDEQRQAFEQHLVGCEICREDLEHLRVAAEALPRSVEQYRAPESLKASLMTAVRAEAPQPERTRARPALGRFRPAFPRLARAATAAALALVLVAVGFYELGQRADEGERTLTAQADDARVPEASGRLVIPDDESEGAILEVNGVPRSRGREVLHVWVRRGDQVVRSSMFEVGAEGRGFAAVPDDLGEVDLVMVTREQRPVPAPTEEPILTFHLRA
jgi:anti-sigma-K factor RskA